MENEWEFEQDCKQLRFSTRDGHSNTPDSMAKVRVRVTQVMGTSPTLADGERYIIRGTYEVQGDAPVKLGAVINGKSRCRWSDLAPGTGEFDTRVLVLEPDDPRNAGHICLMLAGHATQASGARVFIEIKP